MQDRPRFHAVASHSDQDLRGNWITRSVRRISETSEEEAQRLAERDVRALVERIKAGETDGADRYAYGQRGLVEPVLKRIEADQGGEAGRITVNSYGCEVLNTPSVWFIDVDLPGARPRNTSPGLLGRLLGRKPEPAPEVEATPEEETALSKLSALVDAAPHLGFRVYRTAGGLRYLCSSALFDPTMDELNGMMERLGADANYIQLCRVQKTFRARLTPKPWRCGLQAARTDLAPGVLAPGPRYERWKSKYAAKASGYAVCRLIKVCGASQVHPAVEKIMRLHDEAVGSESGLPLA